MYTFAVSVIFCLLTASSGGPIDASTSESTSKVPNNPDASPSRIPDTSAIIPTPQPTRPPSNTPANVHIPQRTPPPVVETDASKPGNCSTAALDHMVEFGCWGYVECINGVTIRHDCPENQVFERDSKSCVDIARANTDCKKDFSCVGRDSGLYADKGDKCQTYVSCLGGVNLGRQYCPANLVFNEKIQTCDFSFNVEPPCGTKKAEEE